MASRPQIAHHQIVAYLRGECDEEQSEHLLKTKESDPVYQLFFELVDRLKSKTVAGTEPLPAQASYSFAEIEEMLMGFFSGDIQPAEAQQFVDTLTSSPDFYRRLLIKLRTAAPQVNLDDVPEIAQVTVRTDEALLAEMMAHVQGKRPVVAPRGESVPQPLSDIWDSLHRLLEYPLRLPRYAFVLLFLIAGSVASWLVYENLLKKEPFAQYVYDDRVPYEYHVSSLRGTAQPLQEDSLFQAFVNRFKLSMSDYLTRDYASTIRMLENLRPAALSLATRPKHERFVPWLRDFYFYLGLSHFALSRNRESSLSEEAKGQHIEQSILWLAQADSLVAAYALAEREREDYFLGLVLGFAGHEEAAVGHLRKIKAESAFYQDGIELISKWSKQ